jgi:hypothetical protein
MKGSAPGRKPGLPGAREDSPHPPEIGLQSRFHEGICI